MKIDGDTVTFSSGRTAYANCGIVGINSDLELTHGYDGSIDWPVPDWWREEHPEWITKDTMTVEDMAELSDHMIETWTKFKATLAR